MTNDRELHRQIALDRSSLAYRHFQTEYESLPREVRQPLAQRIGGALDRESENREYGERRKQEVSWMTAAMVCAQVPELEASSQRFLRSRLEYLQLGGTYGQLSDFR